MAMSTRAPVRIGEVIRNGVVFDPKNWRSRGVTGESLLDAVSRLFALLEAHRVEYVLVGGVAMLQYVEGRNTQDLDLILDADALKNLPGIQVFGGDADFARARFGELQIDILRTQNLLFDKVRRRYSAVRHFQERDIPCATVEGLLLLKMHALPSLYRQGNFARVGLYENDIATLLHAYRPEVEPLIRELAPHLSGTDLRAIRQIVQEISERIARFEKSGPKTE